MFVAGRFRVMWHQSGHFMVAEAAAPQGPWGLVHHNLTGMAQPSPQWAARAIRQNKMECGVVHLIPLAPLHAARPMGVPARRDADE